MLLQAPGERRGSAAGPRRSSVVVSQELGAILGKPNGLATDAGMSSDAEAAVTLAGVPTVGKVQGKPFFPELGLLTKVRLPPAMLITSYKTGLG